MTYTYPADYGKGAPVNTNVTISITRDAESHLIGNLKRTANGGPETFSDTIIRLSREHERLENENVTLRRVLRAARQTIDAWMRPVGGVVTSEASVLIEHIDTALKGKETA